MADASELAGKVVLVTGGARNIGRAISRALAAGAAAVRFLCGPGARYITGQSLHVNGGGYMA